MDLKQKDRIEEMIQILGGIRDLCIFFEEAKNIPQTVYVVIIAAIEKVVGLLEETAELSRK